MTTLDVWTMIKPNTAANFWVHIKICVICAFQHTKTEATESVIERNEQQLRHVAALIDELRSLRSRQKHAFETWQKRCTEQVQGDTGATGDTGTIQGVSQLRSTPPPNAGCTSKQVKYGFFHSNENKKLD